jgi:hypothetical protein
MPHSRCAPGRCLHVRTSTKRRTTMTSILPKTPIRLTICWSTTTRPMKPLCRRNTGQSRCRRTTIC